MLAAKRRFLRPVVSEGTSLDMDWTEVNLVPLCEGGKIADGVLSASKHMDTNTFKTIIQNIWSEHYFSHETKLHIFFKLAATNEIDKLNALREIPSFDNMSFNVKDRATGKTLVDVALENNHPVMALHVENIARAQRLERSDRGREGYCNRV